MAVDCHVHLTDSSFETPLETVLTTARENGIRLFLCAATRQNEWPDILRCAARHADVIPFIGTHPWFAETFRADFFEKEIRENPHAGVGEIGLDGRRGHESQEIVFKTQLETAGALRRPAIIHCVKAMSVMCPLLNMMKQLPPLLFHAFSGDANDIRFLMKKGAYFSLNAAHFNKFKTLLPLIPPNRLVFDSDAPFMRPAPDLCVSPDAPVNRPENLRLTIRAAAAMLHMTPKALEDLTTRNALAFLQTIKAV